MVRFALLATALFVVGCGDGGGTPNPGEDGGVDDGAPSDGVVDDDAQPADSASTPDAAVVGVACGTTTCDTTQECCVGVGGNECVDQGNCQGVTLTCDGPEDCTNGDVCCASGGGGGPGANGTTCRGANQCNANTCTADTDCSGNKTCCAIQQLGISLCLMSCP